jgi:hypothetical protein
LLYESNSQINLFLSFWTNSFTSAEVVNILKAKDLAKGTNKMTARKIYTFKLNDSTPNDHPGRVGEITYRDGFLYYHDGVTPGGELISGGGGSSGSTTWASVTGKPNFAAVATSGDYADLTNKPAAQILQAPQWNALHNLGTGNRYLVGDLVFNAGTIYQAIADNESQYTAVGDPTYWRNLGTGIRLQTDYLDLANKPSIPTDVSDLTDTTSLLGSGPTNEITNTSPEGSVYSVSVGTDGVVSMVTSRGGLEFGALPEPGGPSHFHIMRPASQQGSSDLYFGDDYNYVLQRSAAYSGAPAYGVEIGANDNNGGAQQVWRFGTDGDLTLPAGGDIKDSTGTSVLGGGFSGDYDDLTNKPTLFDGNYNSLTNKPTIRIAVVGSTGGPFGTNLQADSLALAGLNPTENIPSTYGGDLILQGGVGGANNDLYGEVRIKSGQIGANYEWHFTTDRKIKLPAGGSIVDSTGANVFVSLATLKQVVAASIDFADFQSRIAGMS